MPNQFSTAATFGMGVFCSAFAVESFALRKNAKGQCEMPAGRFAGHDDTINIDVVHHGLLGNVA